MLSSPSQTLSLPSHLKQWAYLGHSNEEGYRVSPQLEIPLLQDFPLHPETHLQHMCKQKQTTTGSLHTAVSHTQ